MRTERDFVRHEKFALIQKISQMLREAPHPVHRAWQEGWTDIACYPDGYTTGDDTRRPSGWYGHRPVTWILAGFRLDSTQWNFICDPDGRNPYFSRTFADPITKIETIG
ncbi:MAG: hypothetical protein KBD19_00290 [Candidatus Moranbacteria bacterium]|nr:hypothetical protein [Candidatus Moranbacteria bacterium]